MENRKEKILSMENSRIAFQQDMTVILTHLLMTMLVSDYSHLHDHGGGVPSETWLNAPAVGVQLQSSCSIEWSQRRKLLLHLKCAMLCLLVRKISFGFGL